MASIIGVLTFLIGVPLMAGEKNTVLVIEKHSVTGYEQTSLTRLNANEWRFVQNSNFLSKKLPTRLGVFIGPLPENLEKRIEKIFSNANTSAKTEDPLSGGYHSLKVYLSGKPLSSQTEHYEASFRIILEAEQLTTWKSMNGRVVAKEDDLKDFSCEFVTPQHSICESPNWGWVHRFAL